MKVLSTIVVGALAVTAITAGLSAMPAAAQVDTSVYIAAVGDIACDPSPQGQPGYAPAYNNGEGTKDGCRQKAVGQAIMAAKPDQFWALGDNQYYDATYAKYMESYDKAFGPLKSITRPIPGNHEWKDLTIPTRPGSGYFTYFGAAAHPESNGTYSFNAGDWHVLAINDNLCDTSNPCGPGSELAAWIASDMAANPKPCTAAMVHHPLWSLGEAHKNGYVPLIPVWNQLHDLGVDIVLTGHDHNYVRTKPLGKAFVDPNNPAKVGIPQVDPNGMVQFVLGTGGVDAYAASAATAQEMASILAAFQLGKPSPGLFGAGGFRLSSDRYTFSYLPAADSHPFVDTSSRTCRRATNGNPQDIAVDVPKLTQKVTWAPTNTTVKASTTSRGLIMPSTKAVTNGDGAITYAVTDEDTSGCTVNETTGAITYLAAGQCEVTATAAATAKFAEAKRAVVFTITPATVTVTAQKVTWTPSNTRVPAASASGGTITPSQPAVSSGDGEITYTVTSAGTTGCTVDAETGEIAYSAPGACQITATAAATVRYTEARRAVVFTITATTAAKKQVVTAVQPASGPLAGGNTVTLVGQGLNTTSKVTIGDVEAKFTIVSDTKVTVVVPAGIQLGPVDIRVTVGPPLGAIVAPGGYTYSSSVTTDTTTDDTVESLSLGNPEVAQRLSGSLRLLSRSEALGVTASVLRRAPGQSAQSAPALRVRTGVPFAVSITGQTAGEVVTISATRRGRTVAVGAARVDDQGVLLVPALVASRAGVITLELATESGAVNYVRVKVTR